MYIRAESTIELKSLAAPRVLADENNKVRSTARLVFVHNIYSYVHLPTKKVRVSNLQEYIPGSNGARVELGIPFFEEFYRVRTCREERSAGSERTRVEYTD